MMELKVGFDRSRTALLQGTLRALGFGLMSVFGVIALAGCSAVPDAVNPVEWYKGAAGWFESEDEAEPPAEATVVPDLTPAADESFPNLASVPEPPVQTYGTAQRQDIAEGLVADREHASYVDMTLRGAGAPDLPAPSATEMISEPLFPAPAPEPTAPGAAPTVPSAAPLYPTSGVETVYQARLAESAPETTAGPASSTPFPSASPALPAEAQIEPMPPPAPAAPEPALPALPAEAQIEPTPPPAPAAPESVASAEDAGGAGAQETAALYPSAPQVPARTIYFAHGSASLSAKSRELLREVAAWQREKGGAIRVVGHSSSRTDDMDPVRHKLTNFKASLDRANAVAQELIRLGVPPDKLIVSAKSDTEPIYFEIMPSGEAGNRRVEIYLDF
ncbi:MAG: OmpA family protein [Alphaproteobacteria bacterium]